MSEEERRERLEVLDAYARFQAASLYQELLWQVAESGQRPTLDQTISLSIWSQIARKGVLHCRNN